MEFYELIEKIISYIPEGFESQKQAAEIILPWILGFCTAATCLFGHTVHKIWNAFFFFWIGFLVPMFLIEFVFAPEGTVFWILAVVCAALGVICAVYSKKLFRIQLFITTLIMVFISVPAYLSFLGEAGSVLAGFLIAVIAAILSIKYKYIMLIITTSFSGSFMLFNIIEKHFGFGHTLSTVFAVIFAFIGLAVQCYVERKELKETYEHLKEQRKKIKSRSKKNKTSISK